MNDAQFTQLMSLLEKASNGASEAFLYWLVFDKAIPGIIWLCSLVLILFLIKKFFLWATFTGKVLATLQLSNPEYSFQNEAKCRQILRELESLKAKK